MATPIRLSELAAGVWVGQSRRYFTNSTVLLDGQGGALVIDPAWDADELAAIPVDLAALGVRCVAGFSTHIHYDHVLWHPDLGQPPRWATPGTVAMAQANRAEVVAPLQDDLPAELIELAARELRPVTTTELEWSGPAALVHVHDAHAPHHAAIEVPDLGLVIAGDMLSDVELPMPDDGDPDLVTYRAGLESLAPIVERSRLLIPGHGSVTHDPAGRLVADRTYLNDLVRSGRSDDPRIGLPDMPELHAANLRRAAATR